jgi:hypothetical protein
MQRKLYSSLLKYGWDAHTFEIIHTLPNDVSQDVLNVYEELYFKKYVDCGFEMLNIKGTGRYGKISDETKALLSISLKKYYENPLNREKQRLATIKGMTPIVNKKISDSKKGKYPSEITKIKMSEAHKGRQPRQSDYTNIIKARLGLVGRKQTDIEKKRRATKLCKKIEVDGIIYESIKIFSEINNIDRTTVFNRLNSNKHKNYIRL